MSLLTEGLAARGVEVTLFATDDSKTRAKLRSICPRGYEEDPSIQPKVWECLHIAEVFNDAHHFDLIHNQFDFLPLSYSALVDTPVVTTIHGFSSPGILPVYRAYNASTFYVAISDADRHPDLDYVATVHHGIDIENFDYRPEHGDYLLFFGRIHSDKGAREAIEIARKARRRLIIAGIVQDQAYFETFVAPKLDGKNVEFVGSADSQRRNALLGGARALLHPIQFSEPFGLSVVESMACGTPVIAFARGSMPELIRHRETGFLVNTVDEAVDAVDKVTALQRLACRCWVETRFSTDRMVDDYLRVYTTVLQEWPKVLAARRALRGQSADG